MENKRYKPKLDKLYFWITVPTAVLMLALTALQLFLEPGGSWVATVLLLLCDLLVFWFLLSPLCGYVELKGGGVFIKYGFILKKEIPYEKIRGLTFGRGIISESMMSLKNAMDHVNIKYNTFDITVISVVDNEGLVEEINKRRGHPDAR